jgi:hypothetical protein
MTTRIKQPSEYMRKVVLRPYRAGSGQPRWELFLIDSRYADGRDRVTYRFDEISAAGVREIVAEGDDFGPSPQHAVDSDDAVAALLSFLTLREHDTDQETFERLVATPRHRQFSEQHAEAVSAEAYFRFEKELES